MRSGDHAVNSKVARQQIVVLHFEVGQRKKKTKQLLLKRVRYINEYMIQNLAIYKYLRYYHIILFSIFTVVY